MKKIVLKNLHLVNFRGHRDFEIDFAERTSISGDNRLGKSTVFDAFLWLLFGKDQFDRKDHEIIPIMDGKRQDRVDPEVSAILDFDGGEISLRRVFHQKWVRKRGAAEETYDGSETLYYMNHVPMKAGEYKKRIDLMVDETVFKLITNPAMFLDLHWQKQREFLFQIAGTVSDAEIAAMDPKFSRLLDMVTGKSLSEYKKELSALKKKLKADLDNIQPKIDQTARLMPEEDNFDVIERDIHNAEAKIRDIDEFLSDGTEAIRKQYESIQQRQGNINDLRGRQSALVNEAVKAEMARVHSQNMKISELENEIRNIQYSISQTTREIGFSEQALGRSLAAIETREGSLRKLRREWSEANEAEYKAVEGSLVCPLFGHVCKDTTANENQAEATRKASEAFLRNKLASLSRIESGAAALKKEIDGLHGDVAGIEEDIRKSNEYLTGLRAELSMKQETLKAMPVEQAREIVPAEVPGWDELEGQIRELEAAIKAERPVELDDKAREEAAALRVETVSLRDNLKRRLMDRELIARYKDEIRKLEDQGADLSQQIADAERMEFTIDAFNRVKIQELENRVNRLFRIVKWQLFDRTLEGNEFEACIPLNLAGVPVSVTNTAERLNIGIDIINRLSEFYEVSAPIFVDGAESVNAYELSQAQMIFLRVTRDKSLVINHF